MYECPFIESGSALLQRWIYISFKWLSVKWFRFQVSGLTFKNFQQLFTPALKGEVAENQSPFRGGVKLIFSFDRFFQKNS